MAICLKTLQVADVYLSRVESGTWHMFGIKVQVGRGVAMISLPDLWLGSRVGFGTGSAEVYSDISILSTLLLNS